jgi:hypothetical protein
MGVGGGEVTKGSYYFHFLLTRSEMYRYMIDRIQYCLKPVLKKTVHGTRMLNLNGRRAAQGEKVTNDA